MKFVPKPLHKTADASRGTVSARTFLRNTVLVLLFVGAVYLLLGIVAEVLARSIPDRWERKLAGVHDIGTTEAGGRLERSERILDRLTENADLRELDYALFLMDSPEPNAFALPGGGIGVTSGLLEMLETETGLAFVLAHELGHHQNRDILRRMGRGLIFALAGIVLFGNDSISPLRGAWEAGDLHFSRRQERRADEWALKRLFEVYGETDNALEFLEKMRTADNESRWLAYARTHPPTSDRLAHLQRLEEELTAREDE